MQQLAVPTEAENEIRRVLDARFNALRMKDAERFVSHYAPDVVTFDLAPPLCNAGLDVRSTGGRDSWFDGWTSPIWEDVSEFTATVAEEEGIAYCHGLVRLRGEKTDEGTVDLWFRSTWCLRRMRGAWKITHEHNSAPCYLDGTDRAALDLVPSA